MTKLNEFLQAVEDGKAGKSYGLNMGLPRFSYTLGGLQKKALYVLFGAEGTGKSSFAINSFIMGPYDHVRSGKSHVDLQIRYYSLEVDSVSVISKLYAWKIYDSELTITSTNQILSRSKKDRITPYIEKKIEATTPYVEDLFKHLTIIDRPMTPDEIKKDISLFASSRGTFFNDENGNKRYRPHNPNEHVVIIVDTLSNLKVQTADGRTDRKGTIDHHSSLCRDYYRNLLHYSVCNIMHSNREIAGSDRAKFGQMFPTKEDIMYSSQPSQDAEVVIALFNPLDYATPGNGLLNLMNYDVARMNKRLIVSGVLKNRYGDKNVRVPLLFVGESAYFKELKSADQMTNEQYKYIETLGLSDVTPESKEKKQVTMKEELKHIIDDLQTEIKNESAIDR